MEIPNQLLESSKESPKIAKEFSIESNKEFYILKIGKNEKETEIYFSVFPKENILLLYEEKFSLNDLTKLSKCFRFFNSINDLIEAFDDMIKNKKILIEKPKNDNLSLKLEILMTNFIGKEEKVLIELKMTQSNEEGGNKNLIFKILELENKLKQKDEEIKSLNEEIKALNNKFNEEIKNINNKFNEEITNLNNKFKLCDEERQNLKNLNNKFRGLEKRIKDIENKGKFSLLLNSDIINNKNDISFILKRLNLEKTNFSLNLIYKCSKSNDNPEKFHNICDGKRNILVFIKTDENVKFGGYSLVGFNSISGKTKDNEAFLFSIDKQKIFNIKKDNDAIYCHSLYGPCFCGTYLHFNINIYGDFLNKNCNTSEAGNNNYDINNDYELNNSKYEFFIKNLEIFQIIID